MLPTRFVEISPSRRQGSQVPLPLCVTNGICRYTDTAVPAHPHRFYRTVTP